MSIIRENHIFIHNPKVAGSSISKVIGGSGHRTLYGISNQVDIEKYFKWMVVRNPYDRLISCYTYYKKNFPQKVSLIIENDKQDKDSILFLKESLTNIETFVDNLDKAYNFEMKNFDTIINKKDFLFCHIIPQYLFCCIDEINRLDYVCRLETIEQDLRIVSDKIAVPSLRSISHVNKSSTSHKKLEILQNMSGKTIEKINNLYKKDFEMFSYEQIK